MFRVVLITAFFPFAAPQVCPPGTFLYTIVHNGQHFCIECQDGTFMPYKDHQQPLCRPCEKIKDSEMEILVSPCNKTDDAVIHCVDGYYRDEARNPGETGQCKKCTECEFVGQPCSTYRDAVCCWDENYDVVPDQNGVPVCRERPWFCRKGQYFDTRQFFCLACPANTFMPLDFHIQTECLKCIEYRPLHSVIIQPCNSTHGPVIRCEDGFFMNPKMSYRHDALGCSPCTDCSTTDVQYEGRKCDGMEDTVCCPQPNMTVVDKPDGPVCLALSDDCDKGDCQHYDVRKKSKSCAPCKTSGDIGVTDFSSSPTELEHTTAKLSFIFDTKNATRPVVQEKNLKFNLAIGALSTLVLLIILLIFYMKYLRHRVVFKTLEVKLRSFCGSPMASQCGDRDSDDKDVEARQPLTEKQLAFIGNFQTPSTLPDDREVEMAFGNEDDLLHKKDKCEESSNHAKFTHVKNFRARTLYFKNSTMQKLPGDYRHLPKNEYINTIFSLAVRIRVQHVSVDRQVEDPYYKFAGLAGAGLNRYGSGMVFQMSKEFGETGNQQCPCLYCQPNLSNSRKSWAEFLVVTSAQLVFDDTECRNASCRLWFDEDNETFASPSLSGRKVKFVKEKGICIMYCVTHDRNVSEKLKDMVNHFNELRERSRLTPSTYKADQFTNAVVIFHPHGLGKRISVGKAKAEIDGQKQKWTIDAQTCPGCLGAPVCLLGDEQNSEIWTPILTGDNKCERF